MQKVCSPLHLALCSSTRHKITAAFPNSPVPSRLNIWTNDWIPSWTQLPGQFQVSVYSPFKHGKNFPSISALAICFGWCFFLHPRKCKQQTRNCIYPILQGEEVHGTSISKLRGLNLKVYDECNYWKFHSYTVYGAIVPPLYDFGSRCRGPCSSWAFVFNWNGNASRNGASGAGTRWRRMKIL